ncbi:MAG: winged helix-turn-helix domain-containing protein [Deltaproteobacteria bacterium]|nr:winged helix-turn-helix domain-containing protein [Deltaproteobacteria bacterium]
MPYQFEAFEFDGKLGTLNGPEGEIHLRPQTFRVLATLIEEAPRVVSGDELVERAWDVPFVSSDSIRQALSELRRALGDDAQNSRIIQTVHRRGYRFIASLSELPKDDFEETPAAEAGLPAEPIEKASANGSRFPLKRALAASALLALSLFLFARLAPSSSPPLEQQMVEQQLAPSPNELPPAAEADPPARNSEDLALRPGNRRRGNRPAGRRNGGRQNKGQLMELTALRLKTIDALLESGTSVPEIARQLEISERSVHQAAKLLEEMADP